MVCGLGARLGFGSAAVAGFAGLRCCSALPVTGHGAAGVLTAAGALAAGTGFRACVCGVARGVVGGVLRGVLVVEVDEVVVVGEVGESGREALLKGVDGEGAEAEEIDVGDVDADCGSGAAILYLWAGGVMVQVLAHFVWCPLCVQVPMLSAVSYVVCGVVVELFWIRGLVSYRGGLHISSRTLALCAPGSGGVGRKPAGCRACPPP